MKQTIGLIAPSDRLDRERFRIAVRNLEKALPESRIFKAPNLLKIHGLFAGTDDQRLADLHYIMKKNPDLIMSVRGGYGTTRLLDRIDFGLLKKNRVPLMGYSDFTGLMIAANQMAGVPGYYGAMLLSDFSGRVHDRQVRLLKRVLNHEPLTYNLPGTIIKKGRQDEHRGIAIAGCLSLLTALTGTRYFQQYKKDNIMFIEDIGEEPYKLDRMFTHLKTAGVFKRTKALLVDFRNCRPAKRNRGTLPITDSLREIFADYDFPIIDFPRFGHRQNRIIIPIGAACGLRVSGSRITLNFKET